jgi:hypothetical protein
MIASVSHDNKHYQSRFGFTYKYCVLSFFFMVSGLSQQDSQQLLL